MAKYEVKLKQIEHYLVEVEADDLDEDNLDNAIEKAWGMIEDEEGKEKYHNFSDGEAEATEKH